MVLTAESESWFYLTNLPFLTVFVIQFQQLTEPLEFLCPLYISFLKKIWRTLVSFVGPLIALLHSVLYALLVTSALGFKSRVNIVSSKETRIRTPISGTGFLSHELTS